MSCLVLAELFETHFPALVSEVNIIGKLPRQVGRSGKEWRQYKQNIEEERKRIIARVYHDVIEQEAHVQHCSSVRRPPPDVTKT